MRLYKNNCSLAVAPLSGAEEDESCYNAEIV